MTTCETIRPWPELLKPATAAAMLDLSESAFRAIWPTLAARHGLRVVGLCGPKFQRANLLAVVEDLAGRGLDIRMDGGSVLIGDERFTVGSSASGKAGRRGRPPKSTAT